MHNYEIKYVNENDGSVWQFTKYVLILFKINDESTKNWIVSVNIISYYIKLWRLNQKTDFKASEKWLKCSCILQKQVWYSLKILKYDGFNSW